VARCSSTRTAAARDSALAYARREVEAAPGTGLAARLAGYDDAVAVQAASLLRARDPAGFEAAIAALIAAAPAPVARGLQAYVDEWRDGRR
jgi:hypothetical protein